MTFGRSYAAVEVAEIQAAAGMSTMFHSSVSQRERDIDSVVEVSCVYTLNVSSGGRRKICWVDGCTMRKLSLFDIITMDNEL